VSESIKDSEVEFAGGLAVRGAHEVPGAAAARADLLGQHAPSRLAEQDATLWGPEAEHEASIRLGWVDTFRRSRDLLPQLRAIKEELKGLDHVVLAGMGGSSLAPEVIARTLGVGLTVLDTTDPHQVRSALADRLDRTVVVVSSKSGSTVETDSHRRTYWQAFVDAGVAEPGRRFVVVTDPGSPLEATGREMGAHVILADPNVGGRYSALTAFGLVPTALAGVNVAELLDQAEEFAKSVGREDGENPSLALGAALGAAAAAGRDKVSLVDDGTGIRGLGDWAEQLLAESTGKQGTGILPVVVETPAAPGALGDDVLTVTLGGQLGPGWPSPGVAAHLCVNGPLGAQFLAWEAATALAGRILGIDPFDQPNVTESKENTAKILSSGGAVHPAPLFVDGAVEVHGEGIGGATTLRDALAWLVGGIDPTGYLAVMAYLDRFGDASIEGVRAALAAAAGRPVTFGWGPRFLHSTGQYHKGGPANGSFLQITGAVTDDLPVPDRVYTFGGLQAAQAAGDRLALTGQGAASAGGSASAGPDAASAGGSASAGPDAASAGGSASAGRDRPLLWLHLTDRAAGAARLLAAARDLSGVSS
jgi:glucose-6-phosphate isomerase